MKNKLKNVGIVVLLIVALIIAAFGGVALGKKVTQVLHGDKIQFSNQYYAAQICLGDGINYHYVTCVDDTSQFTVTQDSIVLVYRNEDRATYKLLYQRDSTLFYGIRKDGVVVEFLRMHPSFLPPGKGYEMLMVTQPELKLILNAYEICPKP